MSLAIRPLSPVLGAEVTGLDLEDGVDETTFAALGAALDRHSLLVIRGQARLTPARHVDFSRRFGPLEQHVQARFHLKGHPEILVVSNIIENGEPIGLVDAGQYWHSDLSYMAEPSLGSLLHAKEIPEEGGDTLFVAMHAAYEALDPALQARIAGLRAEHSYLARNEKQAAKSALRPQLDAAAAARVPPVVHPVVRRHPGSGRPALFVNEGFTTRILDIPEAESRAILDTLFAHMTEQRFQYRHRWRAHDLVFWDNRATIHLATGCPPQLRRRMHRTTVRGDRPVGLAVAA